MPLSPTEDQKTQIMVVKICETDLQLKLVQSDNQTEWKERFRKR